MISANTGTIYYGVVVLMSHKKTLATLPNLIDNEAPEIFFLSNHFLFLILSSSCETLLGLLMLGSNDDVCEIWSVTVIFIGVQQELLCNDGPNIKNNQNKN